MKNIISILILLVSFQQSNGQYVTLEDAFQNNENLCQCITLTPDDSYMMGAFWHENALDLSESFELIVEPRFGCNVASADGGDGMAFILQEVGTGLFPTGSGGNLGYNGIVPSLAVQFDTYRDNPIDFPETNDPGGGFFPFYDHVGLMANGSCNHESSEDLFTGSFSPAFTDVEDCATYSSHQITLNWDANTQDLEVIYCNDVEGCFTVFNQNVDIANTIFSGNNLVYWGFTASTGGAQNEQGVCIQYFDRDTILSDTTICYGENLEIDLSCINNFSFEWTDNLGNVVSNTGILDEVAMANTSYTLTLTNDFTGSTFTETFSVTVLNPELEEDLSQHIDNLCFGEANGQLGINYVDAVGQVNYSINGGTTQNNNIFSNLFADSYEVIAIDGNNCADTVSVIITEEAEILVAIDNITGVVCNTVNTGSIEITPSGGVGGFTTFWEDQNGIIYNSEDLINISDGFYDYFITDANNCEVSDQILVEQINSVDMDTTTLVNVDCYQFSTGEISITPTGGLAPFDYSWTGPNGFTSTSNTINNLEAGNYTLTLTDFENCYKIYPIDITEGDEVLITINDTVDAKCTYSADGELSVTHSGGTGNTTVIVLDALNNQVSNLDFTNTLTTGDYTVYAEDDLGCVSATLGFTISSPSDMVVNTLDIDDAECFGGDEGKIQVNVSGGTLPYTGFNWTGPNGFTSTQPNIYSLFAGAYTVSVTDNNNCIKQETFTIIEPNDISISALDIEFVKCKGDNSGSISLNVIGGTPPYGNFSWTGPNGFTSVNLDIFDLFEGEYTITVEDDNDCKKSTTFDVYEPDALLQFNLNPSPSCLIQNTGSASVDISGGVPPYTTNWFGENPDALSAGQHFVEVSDDANCIIVDSFIVELLPQPIADFTVDSILKLNTPINIQNNSDGETEWSWNFGNQTFSILESPSPIYTFEDSYIISLEVTNDFGCSDTTSRQIRAIDNLILYIPNTFSPNGDLKNDIFSISILNEAEFEVKIYNSFGERLFSTTDKTQGWDGKYKGKDLQEDTYIVTLFATDVFGRVYKKNKSFNLIR